ncbi:transposase [Streptomyces sp. NPDC001933]|uniref:transposase n=1 Tax=Streptomyces sp. NPDC001933 TaxID=3364626 RepID=UPI00368B4D1D
MERQGRLPGPACHRPDREQVRDLLCRFYRRCADADLPELQRLATTVETWWPEILAFLHTGITNAGSEDTNRVIKTIARDAYGFRNPATSAYAPAARPPVEPVDTLMPANFVEPAPCNRVGWRHRTVSTAGVRLAVAGSSTCRTLLSTRLPTIGQPGTSVSKRATSGRGR